MALTEKEVYEALIQKVNGPAGRWEKEFIERFKLEHPTLQQGIVRHLIIPALQVLATQRPDARNQGSHDFAVKALEAAGDTHLPLI